MLPETLAAVGMAAKQISIREFAKVPNSSANENGEQHQPSTTTVTATALRGRTCPFAVGRMFAL
jgi:hypothetical protein